MSAARRGLRQAMGSLRATPVTSIAAITSLALGIAAATTVFSVIDGAMLRQPPFDDPSRLFILTITRSSTRGVQRERWSWTRFQALRQRIAPLYNVASFSVAQVTLTGTAEPEPLDAEVVSPSYLGVLRVAPALGHRFADDDRPGANREVLLAHQVWRDRFGADPSIVGRPIELNGLPLTVAGVLPAGFAGLSGRARVWVPATMAPELTYQEYLTTNQNFISVVGRLGVGQVPREAAARLAIAGAQVHAQAPSGSTDPGERFAAIATSLNDSRVDPGTRGPLTLLLAAVGLLLLLACANVASLLLGKAAGRRREIAIRAALGATRGRLVRQLMLEAAIMALLASAAGALLAAWASSLATLPAATISSNNFYGAIGEFATPDLDFTVLAFCAATGSLTIMLFGLAPALQATRVDLVRDLRGNGRSREDGRPALLGRKAVVIGEVALAAMLLIGGGLLLASFARRRTTDVGFDPSRLLTFAIRPSEVKYPPSAAPALIERVLDEIGRLPGVAVATVDGCAPLGTVCANATLHLVGEPPSAPGAAPFVLRHYVASGHFRALGTTLVRGREFTADDRAGRPHVAIINETAARRFFPGRDPIGERVWFDGAAAFASTDSAAEIVGIVRDVAYQRLDERPFQPDFFTPYLQFTYASRMVLVRTTGDPLAAVPAVRRALARVDPGLAPVDVQPMTRRMKDSYARQTAQTWLLDAFATVALLIAGTGLYGVTAQFVAQRRQELGIRVALGAPRAHVRGVVIGQTLRLALIGLIIGVAGAAAGSRLVAAQLYGTTPWEPGVFLAVPAMLLLVSVVACLAPVRRATGVDPVEALRSDG